MRLIDTGPEARSTATEFGLDFVALGWESFDLTLYQGIFFRSLFRQLVEQRESPGSQEQAIRLEGYDFSETGKLI